MQINYKDASIEMTPQEFNDLVKDDLVDEMISAVLLLGMPLDEDSDTLEETTGNAEEIDDEERIRSLFKSFKRFTTDDDDEF